VVCTRSKNKETYVRRLKVVTKNVPCKARIRLEIEIEIGLEFNQSEGRKPISSLVNFALIDQNPIQSQSQSLV